MTGDRLLWEALYRGLMLMASAIKQHKLDAPQERLSDLQPAPVRGGLIERTWNLRKRER